MAYNSNTTVYYETSKDVWHKVPEHGLYTDSDKGPPRKYPFHLMAMNTALRIRVVVNAQSTYTRTARSLHTILPNSAKRYGLKIACRTKVANDQKFLEVCVR